MLIQTALKVIGFKDGQCEDMQSVLAGILHLGNVEFMNAGGAQVANPDGIKDIHHITLDNLNAVHSNPQFLDSKPSFFIYSCRHCV